MKKNYPVLIAFFTLLQISKISGQYCVPFEVDEIEFQAETKFVKVEASWYPSWIEYHNGKIVFPKSLEPLAKWDHPYMKDNLPSAMHEDSYASDISNMQGPVPENATVQYFQVKEKG